MTSVLDEAPLEHPPELAPRSERPRAARRSRRRLVGMALAAAGLGVLLSLVAVELVFRLFVPVTSVPYYFWDPIVGPRRVPNKSGRYVAGNHIDTRYDFNAQGWNAQRDYSTTKPAGTRRVVLLGDSFVEALQVDPNQSMFVVAEERMSRPERPVEWYALANSGWGTTQQLQLVRHYAFDYEPDLVVLLFVENDPLDSSPYLAPIEPFVATYTLGPDNELVYEQPLYWQRGLLKRWAIESAAIRWFVLQKGLIHRGRNVPGDANMPIRESALAASAESGDPRLQLPLDERQRLTWKLIEETLAAAAEACRQNGTRLAVAFRGSMYEIEAARTGEPLPSIPREDDPYCLGPRRFEMGREQLAPICQRHDIAYLDLTDALRAAVRSEGEPHVFADDQHYNVLGQRVAGETLAAWVETLWEANEPTDLQRQEATQDTD